MIKEFFTKVWKKIKTFGRWCKRKVKQIAITLGIIGVATAMTIPAVLPDHSFESLPNVAKEQGLYRVTFDQWSDVELPEIDIPTAKLKKWGDETYIKISYPDFDKKIKPKQEDKKLKWKGKDMEVHLYPLEPRIIKENGHTFKQLEQGGFDFEIILKKKPATNKIVIPIETKGLKFLYQPSMIEQIGWGNIATATETTGYDENGNIISCIPENVVGSYAIYHDTKSKHFWGNETDAEKYKTGKAFHIYRPKLIDSNGWEVWGELKIENGKLEVGIPIDFWNNSVYPISTGSTNFGYESIGSGDGNIENTILAGKATSGAEGGTGEYIKAAVKYSTNAKNAKAHLFLNDAGGTRVTNGDTAEVQTDQTTYDWEQYNFNTAPTIVASTDYQIGVWGYSYIGAHYVARDTNMGHSNIWNSLSRTYNSWADLGDAATEDYYDHSIYCTYTPAVAGTNMQINIGDAWKDVSEIKINIGDVWKDVSNIWINIGDAWKVVY